MQADERNNVVVADFDTPEVSLGFFGKLRFPPMAVGSSSTVRLETTYLSPDLRVIRDAATGDFFVFVPDPSADTTRVAPVVSAIVPLEEDEDSFGSFAPNLMEEIRGDVVETVDYYSRDNGRYYGHVESRNGEEYWIPREDMVTDSEQGNVVVQCADIDQSQLLHEEPWRAPRVE